MATSKRRLSITLSSEDDVLITRIAKRGRVPQATKVSELLHLSLALEEDKALSFLADLRISEKGKRLSHSQVWGNK